MCFFSRPKNGPTIFPYDFMWSDLHPEKNKNDVPFKGPASSCNLKFGVISFFFAAHLFKGQVFSEDLEGCLDNHLMTYVSGEKNHGQ